jgi:hypothetical protein
MIVAEVVDADVRSPDVPPANTVLDGYGLTCAVPATLTPLPDARRIASVAVEPMTQKIIMFRKSCSVVPVPPAMYMVAAAVSGVGGKVLKVSLAEARMFADAICVRAMLCSF